MTRIVITPYADHKSETELNSETLSRAAAIGQRLFAAGNFPDTYIYSPADSRAVKLTRFGVLGFSRSDSHAEEMFFIQDPSFLEGRPATPAINFLVAHANLFWVRSCGHATKHGE